LILLCQLIPESGFFGFKGWALYRLGRFDEALKVMESLENEFQKSLTCFKMLPFMTSRLPICEALNLNDRALAYYRKSCYCHEILRQRKDRGLAASATAP
jgi:tetratricopeptide (TPR) repeat protein